MLLIIAVLCQVNLSVVKRAYCYLFHSPCSSSRIYSLIILFDGELELSRGLNTCVGVQLTKDVMFVCTVRLIVFYIQIKES